MDTMSAPPHVPRRTRGPLALAASAVVLCGLGYVVFWLAAAPIHGVARVEDCARAYAKAQTARDSLAVDFTSYADAAGHTNNTRCGYIPKGVAQGPQALR